MAWGEEHTPAGASFEVARAADALAEAVRMFLDVDETGDETLERALKKYDQARRIEP